MFENVSDVEKTELLFMTSVMQMFRTRLRDFDIKFRPDTQEALCIHAGVAAKDALHVWMTEPDPLKTMDSLNTLEGLL